MTKREYHSVPDLFWYFNDAESELGARAQQYELQARSTAESYGNTTCQERAAVRFARIDAIVRSMPLVQQEILLRWYAIGHYPAITKAEFKKYVGVAMLTKEINAVARDRSQTVADAFRMLCVRANAVCPDTQHSDSCRLSGHPCKIDKENAKNSVHSALAQAKKLVETAHAVYSQQEELYDKQQEIYKKKRLEKLLRIK